MQMLRMTPIANKIEINDTARHYIVLLINVIKHYYRYIRRKCVWQGSIVR